MVGRAAQTHAASYRTRWPRRQSRFRGPATTRYDLRRAVVERRQAQDGTTSSIWLGARPGAIREAADWLHARRPFFALADVEENARRKLPATRKSPCLRSRSR